MYLNCVPREVWLRFLQQHKNYTVVSYVSMVLVSKSKFLKISLTKILCVWFDINAVLGVEITVFWDVKCVLWRDTFLLYMEAKCSSETLLRMYKTGRRHMSEHRNLDQWQTLGGFYDLTCNTSCFIHPPKYTFFLHCETVWRSTQT